MEYMQEVEDNKIQEEASDFSENYIEKFEGEQIEEFYSGDFVSWEKIEDRFLFHAEDASLEVTVITSDIIKFRYANDGRFEDDFSYALDPSLKKESVVTKLSEKKDQFLIKTNTLKCIIKKKDLITKITDLNNKVLLEDEKGYHWSDESKYGGNVVISTKKIRKDEHFFGLGDKTGKLNLRNSRNQLWGTDCYGYGTDTDPVYKNIPFYMGLNDNHGYGIFMDNTFRSFFDFGKERAEACSFWAQGSEMRYYFINGPHLMDVAKKYTYLTGTAQLPPKWALGYHQSKWSYYPEAVVKKIGEEFRERKIPCDVIHLDIDYMDGYRCFTWDKDRFPDPKKMINELKEDGFKTVVIIDPGIKIDKKYSVYQEGVENDYFCKRADGALYKGSVWPGLCHFPDFTNKKAREWWAGLYDGLVEDGVAGVWNDMNEPATFEEGTFPFDVRHDYDGHPGSHRKAHNVYGSLMAQATCEGQEKYLDNKRAFTITRSAYSGVQRYASVWTGDNSASWEQLKLANTQCQRLSESGISFAGSDVGGFIGSPDGELFTRWIQMAVFHPFFRTHSSGDHGDKEPWRFDKKYVDIVRRFIELRYQIMPYLYTTFWQYSSEGVPMLRPLHLIFQEDPETHFREEEFFLGDHLLICPISVEGADIRKMYLPEGAWFNYWTGAILEGKKEIVADAPLDKIPLFVRAGAVIAQQPIMQYVDEFVFDQLTLHLYKPLKKTVSQLYEDDGDGLQYKEDIYALKSFTSENEEGKWKINQSRKGQFVTSYQSYEAVFHGLKSKPTSLLIDGVEKVNEANYNETTLTVTLPKNFNELLIS
jgi:alpha-glucosidase